MNEPIQAVDLVARLKERRATVATAESLTGGRLAARMSEAPGSSEIFLGGAVTYATEAKVKVLGVAQEVVDEHGVVSAECARAMAEGARRLLGSTYGVSTTGVAGPDTQEGKPVGTVFVGVAGPNGTDVVPLALDGDRESITNESVAAAVEALVAALEGRPEE
ncbi:PncC family amidohydrolase [Nocardioides thalensis]|uniref:PncC family amidohydrolase n=1 Tax=Nocardioides thalensis TaxID=1914755 RepID=A0A853C4T5_9ACTN|nr:PncC family amidohydrolase [Nocardioides thalensis]